VAKHCASAAEDLSTSVISRAGPEWGKWLHGSGDMNSSLADNLLIPVDVKAQLVPTTMPLNRNLEFFMGQD